MDRSSRFPSLREFRARASRLGMAAGDADSPSVKAQESKAQRSERSPALTAVWLILGVGSAGWLVWAALNQDALAPRVRAPKIEPTTIATAPTSHEAFDQRIAGIETELYRLGQDVEDASEARAELDRRVSTMERAFGPTTGSLGPGRPRGPVALSPSDGAMPAAAMPRSFDEDARAPTAPRPITPDRRTALLPPSATQPQAAPSTPAFALDLGGFANLQMVYDRWAMLAAAGRDIFAGLSARVITQIEPDGSRSYRLIAGPLDDIGKTGRLCDYLANRDVACTPTIFVGEPL